MSTLMLGQQFSKDGTALTSEQREARAERKGLCSRCGIKTHKTSLGRRHALTNEHVYDGHCIKCDPDMVPLKVCVAWEKKHPDQMAMAKATKLHQVRGFHRSSHGQQQQQQPTAGGGVVDGSGSSSSHLRRTTPTTAGNNTNTQPYDALNASQTSISFSPDRCGFCGIQTHESKTIVTKKKKFGRNQKETQLIPITIEGAVLAGRCLICHPIPTSHPNTNNDSSHQLITSTTLTPPPGEQRQHGGGGGGGTAEVHKIPPSEDGSGLSGPVAEKNPKEQARASTKKRDPDADFSMIRTASQYADGGISHLGAAGEEVELAEVARQRRQSQTSENVIVGHGNLEQQPPPHRIPSSSCEMDDDEDIDLNSLAGHGEMDDDDVDVDDFAKQINVDIDGDTFVKDQKRKQQQKQNNKASSPPDDAAAGFPQSIQIGMNNNKKVDNYDNNQVAIATAVLVVDDPAAASTQNDHPVVPLNINVDGDSAAGIESSSKDDRSRWPAPWPLNRDDDDGFTSDNSSDEDSSSDIHMRSEVGDYKSAISSLNFTQAEDLIKYHMPPPQQHQQQQAPPTTRRRNSHFNNNNNNNNNTAASMDQSMTERSAAVSMADSSLQPSTKVVDDSSRMQEASSMVDSIGMSNSQMQQSMQDHSYNQNSAAALASSNVLMADMLQSGDLVGWLRDFASECQDGEFRAEVAKRGGLVAVISAMKLHKTDVAIQKQGCLALHALAKEHGTAIAKQGGVYCLLSAIKHHGQEDPELFEHACGALVFVVTNDTYKLAVARKGVGPILAGTQCHINYTSVQQQACAVLLRLSSQRDIVDALAHTKHRGIRTIVEGMKRHRDNILLLQYGCGILKNIAQHKETARSTIVNEDGARVLAAAMKLHHNCENLQHQAIWALSEISASEDIAKDGAIGAAINAMESLKGNAKVQQYGCGVLKNLSVTRKNIHTVAKLHGIEAILDAMQNNVRDAALQRYACGALKHLSLSNTNERAIAKMGGIIAVVETMKAHKIDGTVQREACGALRNMSIQDDNKTLIAQHGGVVCLLVAMKLNKNDDSLQQKACGALLNLSSSGDLRRVIASYGGVIAIVAIMQHLANDAKVQQYACGTIKNLAVSTELKKAVAENQGIPAVLAAMKRHIGDGKVQSSGCGALKNLSGNADNKQQITKLKGVVAIIAAMKAHPDDSSLQQEASATLLGLSQLKENVVSIGKHGGVQAIIAAMKRHSKVSAVQSSGAAALWSLSTVGTNMTLIYKNSGIDIVVASMKMHITVATVVHKSCLALSTMAVNEICVVAIQEAGGIAAAFDGMRAHPKDLHVQKYACKFLSVMLQSDKPKVKEEIAIGSSDVRMALKHHPEKDDLKKYVRTILVGLGDDINDTIPTSSTSRGSGNDTKLIVVSRGSESVDC